VVVKAGDVVPVAGQSASDGTPVWATRSTIVAHDFALETADDVTVMRRALLSLGLLAIVAMGGCKDKTTGPAVEPKRGHGRHVRRQVYRIQSGPNSYTTASRSP